MNIPTIDVYMTDFGPVEMGKYAKTLPRRKNNSFDMRYKACREFVAALNSEARRVYTNSRTAFLRRFGDTRPEAPTSESMH